jgi:hypothetical protein
MRTPIELTVFAMVTLALGSGEQLKKLNADGYTFFHIDSEFSEFSCTTCHTGGPQLP